VSSEQFLAALFLAIVRGAYFGAAVLACYRLALLVTREDGPLGIFTRWRRRLGRWAAGTPEFGPKDSVAALFRCPLCLGMWLALPLAVAFFPDEWLLAWFAIAGGQVYLERVSKKQ
jgi:hypothetical protein